MWERYNHIFLLNYTILSWNGGMKFMFFLSYQEMYKNYYGLSPSHTQLLTTIVFFPWVLKFFYGILSDGLPIFGSRKKSWIIIMGLL